NSRQPGSHPTRPTVAPLIKRAQHHGVLRLSPVSVVVFVVVAGGGEEKAADLHQTDPPAMGEVEAPGYFVGRPVNFEEKPKDADQQQANTQGTPGDYFVGRPQHQQQGVQTTPAAATAATSAEQKKPGFFAKLFPCFAPSRAES
ncbi:unnamed protein product, partial [Urochloa humidicola]